MVSLFRIVVVIRPPMHTPNPVKRISPMIILVEYIDIISFASVVHSIGMALVKSYSVYPNRQGACYS